MTIINKLHHIFIIYWKVAKTEDPKILITRKKYSNLIYQ